MSKARFYLAGTVLGGLLAVPTLVLWPADASAAQSSTSASSDGPLVSVCVTVTPKSAGAGVNDQNTTILSVGLSRTCVATPF